jgi:hypothetical protein
MDRQLVTLYALDRARAEQVLPELGRALDDGTVGTLDATGMVEVEVAVPSREQAIERVRDAIAATGAEERFTFPATTGTEHVPPGDRNLDDPLLRREERAAAAEAGEIGGPAPDTQGDEADRPVEEAGGGEAEGFETAEQELAEQASHGEGRWMPEADAFEPEDRAEQTHGEPDEVDPTEVVRDPEEGPDDPGEGPGLASER